MSAQLSALLPEDVRSRIIDLGELSPAAGIPLRDLEAVLAHLESADVLVLGGEGYMRREDGSIGSYTYGTEGWAFVRRDEESRADAKRRSILESRTILRRLISDENAANIVVELVVEGPDRQILR